VADTFAVRILDRTLDTETLVSAATRSEMDGLFLARRWAVKLVDELDAGGADGAHFNSSRALGTDYRWLVWSSMSNDPIDALYAVSVETRAGAE
jgi:hypothetical protein